MTDRIGVDHGQLVRRGFTDPQRAVDHLSALAREGLFPDQRGQDRWLDAMGASADPDVCAASLAAVVPALSHDDRLALLAAAARDDIGALTSVLGASRALGAFLARHPEQVSLLLGPSAATQRDAAARQAAVLLAVGADSASAAPVAGPDLTAALDALRVEYHRQLLTIAGADLHGGAALPWVAEQLADLACAALEGALAIARRQVAEHSLCRFSVIAMGKTGGRELNYISDVDVIFVCDPAPGADEEDALRAGTALATALMDACARPTAEGSLWQVDAALRPEGKAGVLVRTVASHSAYYQRWASTWEFQALLKARHGAGELATSEAYLDALSPMVWAAASRPAFVADVRAMRRRVEQNIPAHLADRQLKLGPGGLRDVEFSVQLLQLVHGRDDFRLREQSTLAGLEALSTHGFVGRDDAAELDRAYRFLRTLEHRIQLLDLRRTHVVPEDEADLRRIGRSMGFTKDPVRELTEAWRGHQRQVRRLHEKLFYRPLLDAVARLQPGQARLSLDAARDRLEALGYADPSGALRHIEALVSGVSRRATVQRALLPVLLSWFADAPDPDAGLLAFRRVSDALGSTPWYLRLLRDEGAAAERMATVLGSSAYAGDLLLRAPEATAMLGDDGELIPVDASALLQEALVTVERQEDADEAALAIRALRRRELLRICIADVLGRIDDDTVMSAVTELSRAAVAAALAAAHRVVQSDSGEALPMRLTIIGMGRFGGGEMGYGSDADVVFVFEAAPGANDEAAAKAALAVANEVIALLGRPSADPPLVVDAGLRPEGRQGPLVRSLASYRAYYERWSLVWESQALLRATVAAGDADLGERFLDLIDPLRYPAGGLTAEQVTEIRRLKARMEAERLPRGADPRTHLKLGPGGLSDVEWVVQLLQLQHAHEMPALRTQGTLTALQAAVDANLVSSADARALADSWRAATAIRHAVVMARGVPADAIPVQPADRARVAHLLGYGASGSEQMVEDYLRKSRRARAVVERLFYG